MYQPKLLPHQVRAIYFLKEHDGRPMTHHVRVAIERYLREYPEIDQVLAAAGLSAIQPPKNSSL